VLAAPLEPLLVPVAENATVRVDVARPAAASRGTLLLIHGLCGDARSAYMVRTAEAALARGWTVALMNLRGCGDTGALSQTLYNAGQSDDAGAVLSRFDREGLPRPFAAAGFSLGGNLLLRYAGRAGAACVADAVAGVNAPIDLERCLRALERPSNAIYEQFFVFWLCRRIRQLRAERTVPGPPANWPAIRRLRCFDELFTAPDGGYPSAAAYYAAASAAPTLGGLRVPALLLSAANDPFVPVGVFEAARRAVPPCATFSHPVEGGHVGYWGQPGERFWAARALLDFFERLRS
jgi:predicted alpha/beta-fold hydrolase